MDESFTVVVSAPQIDGVVAGALVGRAAQGRAEALVFDSERLVDFFRPSVQAKLPRTYDLMLCGPRVMRTDWDGGLIRPDLMDALRRFVGPIRWFSVQPWEPEDVRAIGHLIGEGNLVVSDTAAPAARVVRERYFGPDDEYEDALARFVSGQLTGEEEQSWGARLHKVLTALKGNHDDLAGAVGALMENRLKGLVDRYGDVAEKVEQENREFARENAEQPRPMGDMKLVFLALPGPKHPFWAEMGGYARQAAEAELSLCHLQGRPVMLLSREPGVRANLRAWARYVTDSLPGARVVGAQPDVVPLVISGLGGDRGLKREVLGLMADGAHLLTR